MLLAVLFLGNSAANAQFWQGFMYGLANGLQRMQQQQQYNQNTRRQQERTRAAEPIEETRKYEEGGFEWIKMCQWNSSKRDFIYGAKDEDGNVIIPISRGYTSIYYLNEEGYGGYFSVEKGGGEGVCDRYGKVLYAPTAKAEYICIDGVFKKKNSSGEWVKTLAYLDSDGHGHKKSSGTSSGWGNQFYVPGYVDATATATPDFGLDRGGTSTSSGSSSADILNQTAGEYCKSCNGTGKCHACNGTKVASGLGNTYTCTVCDENGNCSVCHGSGKASWNR